MRRNLLYAVLFVVVLLTDQIPKLIISTTLPYGHPFPVLGELVMFRYVLNPGTVFGLFTAWPGVVIVLKAIGVALMCAITLYMLAFDGLKRYGVPHSSLVRFSLVMISASAVGNFIDRVRVGAVIDFIDAGIGQFRWYIFNIADAYLVIGAILIFLAAVLSPGTDGVRGGKGGDNT